MTSFNVNLKHEIKNQYSRAAAYKVNKNICTLLDKYDVIEIDLSELKLTPSIADEVVGALAEKLGREYFKKKVKIKNATASQMALLKHVVARRVSH